MKLQEALKISKKETGISGVVFKGYYWYLNTETISDENNVVPLVFICEDSKEVLTREDLLSDAFKPIRSLLGQFFNGVPSIRYLLEDLRIGEEEITFEPSSEEILETLESRYPVPPPIDFEDDVEDYPDWDNKDTESIVIFTPWEYEEDDNDL